MDTCTPTRQTTQEELSRILLDAFTRGYLQGFDHGVGRARGAVLRAYCESGFPEERAGLLLAAQIIDTALETHLLTIEAS